MSAKTKIIVLHLKEVIWAGILTVLGLFLILLLILLFVPKKESTEQVLTPPNYHPGIYKSELYLGGNSIEVETIMEQDRISSIRLLNLDEAITTAYPLLAPTMDYVCAQVLKNQSVEDVELEPSAKYTTLVLLDAISNCLEKARVKKD